MRDRRTTMHDPRSLYPTIEPPEQRQPHPGLDKEMEPKADIGLDSYVGHGRLQGRKALITGGDSGIGSAVAVAYAREGADVAISYLPEEQADADRVIEAIEAAGQKALALPGDLCELAQCEKIVRASRRSAGWTSWSTTPAARSGTTASRTSPTRTSTPP